MKSGNKLLENPSQIDLQIFKACRFWLYILIGSDTSSVLNFFVADIGLPQLDGTGSSHEADSRPA